MDTTNSDPSCGARPKKERSHHRTSRSGRAKRTVGTERRASDRTGGTERSEDTQRAERAQHCSTVVDIDSVRTEDESVGHLEVSPQENGPKHRSLGPLEWLLMALVLALVLLLLPLSIWFCVRVVREHERAVVFRLGHLLRGRPRGPGLLFFLPVLDVCHVVDIRLKMLKIPLHTVVTKDLQRAEVSAMCLYQIQNVGLCGYALCSLEPTLMALVQAVIRDVLAQHPLSLVLAQRRGVGQAIQTAADAVLCRWGIRLERADIEELSLPPELQRRLTETTAHSQIRATDPDAWEGLRSSLRLLRPVLVLPLTSDLLNTTADNEPSLLPPPPLPPVTTEMETESTQDSPMM